MAFSAMKNGRWCPSTTRTTPVPRLSTDRKSTRLNSSHTEIYTLSLHDALPISFKAAADGPLNGILGYEERPLVSVDYKDDTRSAIIDRSEEHTSELQSHRDLHSFPTRRSSDLVQSRGGRTVEWHSRL